MITDDYENDDDNNGDDDDNADDATLYMYNLQWGAVASTHVEGRCHVRG